MKRWTQGNFDSSFVLCLNELLRENNANFIIRRLALISVQKSNG